METTNIPKKEATKREIILSYLADAEMEEVETISPKMSDIINLLKKKE